MKERGILFSAPMVRANLDDLKTQTRRALKPQPPAGTLQVSTFHHPDPRPHFYAWTDDGHGRAELAEDGWCKPCPYGQAGDRLRVKEAAWMWCERRPNGKTPAGRDKWIYVPMREAPVHYAADHPERPRVGVVSPDTGNVWGWRLKIGRFMPAWASRITLEITSVRVERLQDISEADAMAEGVWTATPDMLAAGRRGVVLNHIAAYRKLWEEINGAGSWDANSWVWVVSFRKVKS